MDVHATYAPVATTVHGCTTPLILNANDDGYPLRSPLVGSRADSVVTHAVSPSAFLGADGSGQCPLLSPAPRPVPVSERSHSQSSIGISSSSSTTTTTTSVSSMRTAAGSVAVLPDGDADGSVGSDSHALSALPRMMQRQPTQQALTTGWEQQEQAASPDPAVVIGGMVGGSTASSFLFPPLVKPPMGMTSQGKVFKLPTPTVSLRPVESNLIRPGLSGGQVGLLLTLRPDFMDKYEKPIKKRRAPREDLSGLTAEEKVERRKQRARVYTHFARKRNDVIMAELKKDVEKMQIFKTIIDEAPHLVAILSHDLGGRFLFANDAFARVLHAKPMALLGSSIWSLIHPDDRLDVSQRMAAALLAGPGLGQAPAAGPHDGCDRRSSSPGGGKPVRFRLQGGYPNQWTLGEGSFIRGTQGIIMTFWPLEQVVVPAAEATQQ